MSRDPGNPFSNETGEYIGPDVTVTRVNNTVEVEVKKSSEAPVKAAKATKATRPRSK